MVSQDDIIAALGEGDLTLVEKLTAELRLQYALDAMTGAILTSGNMTVDIADWSKVDEFFEYVEQIGYSPVNVFELTKEAFVQARLARDASRMVACGLIIAKAIVPRIVYSEWLASQLPPEPTPQP